SRPIGSTWKVEFCQTPRIAIGCRAWSMRPRTPAAHMERSMWTCQVTFCGGCTVASMATIVSAALQASPSRGCEACPYSSGTFGVVPERREGTRRRLGRLDGGGVRGAGDHDLARAQPLGHHGLLLRVPGVVVLAVQDQDGQARAARHLGELVDAVGA